MRYVPFKERLCGSPFLGRGYKYSAYTETEKVLCCASNVFAHVEYIVVIILECPGSKASGFSGLGLAVDYVTLSLSEVLTRETYSSSMSVP